MKRVAVARATTLATAALGMAWTCVCDVRGGRIYYSYGTDGDAVSG